MKEKWTDLGIRTNAEALVAYLVWNGAEFDVTSTGDVVFPQLFFAAADPIAKAVVEIKKQKE